jgi:hypothetical protein
VFFHGFFFDDSRDEFTNYRLGPALALLRETRCAISISYFETSTPNFSNRLRHIAVVSGAVFCTCLEFRLSGRYIDNYIVEFPQSLQQYIPPRRP